VLQHPKLAQQCDDSITSRQCLGSILAEQCLLSFWWLPSVCHSGIKPMRFCRVVKHIDLRDFLKTTFECRQCLRLWAGINYCSHNAPNVFNRRQIWRIWRPISRWDVHVWYLLLRIILCAVRFKPVLLVSCHRLWLCKDFTGFVFQRLIHLLTQPLAWLSFFAITQ